MTNIYVRNLSFKTAQGDLRAMFSRFGNVERVSLVTDPYNGQSRGFAFVEMTQANEAQKAISELNGTYLHGRTLNVCEARPKPPGGGGGRGSFGGPRKSRGGGW
jgi:RNA recognition motif-containing protein